jgi:transmembrane sensor
VPESDIRSAAAEWDARLRSHRCTDVDRSKFKTWCEKDRRHREAFDRLQDSLAALRQAADHPQIRALREMATVQERKFSARRRIWGVALVASAAAVLIALVYWTAPRVAASHLAASAGYPAVPEVAQSFATRLGERRTVVLPDGSSVTLNAATEIETQWFPGERNVRLVSGQAFFRVAKDSKRPFVVTAADRTVTALGTAFDVKLDKDKVQVTLMEGRVSVRGLGKAAGQPTTELVPREQFVATEGDTPTVRSVDVAMTVGWAEDQLFFTDEGLASAVAEMNRHSAEQIVVGDPALAQYRVNGMFRAGNQRGFVNALSTYYPIDYRQDDQGRIVLTLRQDTQTK